MTRIDQLKGTERRLVVVRHEKDGGMGGGWVGGDGYGVSFRGDESVQNHWWWLNNLVNTPNATGLYTLNMNFIFCESYLNSCRKTSSRRTALKMILWFHNKTRDLKKEKRKEISFSFCTLPSSPHPSTQRILCVSTQSKACVCLLGPWSLAGKSEMGSK